MSNDYTAWLVEKRDHPEFKPAYLALDDMIEIVWVPDADDAVHFARKADAERMCEHGELHDLAIVDHMWPGGLPRDPVIPRWEGWNDPPKETQ